MNLKLKLTIAAIMITLIVVGCGGDDDTTKPTTNNEPFTFIKAGNEWEYEVYDRTNNELVGAYSWEIEHYAMDEYYTVFLSVYELGYENGIGYTLADKDLWVIGGYVPNYCVVFLDKDCYVGKEWELDFCKGIAQIVSLSETVMVPAGTFINCIKIRVEYPDGREDFYWVHKHFGNIMAEENNKIFKLKSKNF